MAKVTILGCSYAIPDSNNEVTHLAIHGDKTGVLIDCGSNPTVRLEEANISYDSITDLILTHFHPDHVSGAPLMLMNMWLLGRTKCLRIHGLTHCLNNLNKLMQAYDWNSWPNFFPIEFNYITTDKKNTIINNDDFLIHSSPGNHMVPVIGLRIRNNKKNGKTIAYSSDTEPCDSIQNLVNKVDILIHEATGKSTGHSSAYQAGKVANKAKAKALLLIHYNIHNNDKSQLKYMAQKTFDGPVKLAFDFMKFDF
ncbi:MAG TPA: hypothetical protein DGM69_01055 [Chloroflexi bacterium]|nr:hypothetical protein [Chloroflexota bacterium]|tara:strand:+ start:345 stop:1103 length:759 start_codon:yes stop_codon:yes gene_type:complete